MSYQSYLLYIVDISHSRHTLSYPNLANSTYYCTVPKFYLLLISYLVEESYLLYKSYPSFACDSTYHAWALVTLVIIPESYLLDISYPSFTYSKYHTQVYLPYISEYECSHDEQEHDREPEQEDSNDCRYSRWKNQTLLDT